MSPETDLSDLHSAFAALMSHVDDRHAELGEFETNLRDRWGMALDLNTHLYLEALRLGSLVLESTPEDHAEKPFPAVMVKLHVRACLVHSEIQALLASGHPAGANARWRTLHEIQVVMGLIAKGGREAARRYLAHDVVETHKRAVEYDLYTEALNLEPLQAGELEGLADRRAAAEYEFGKEVGAQYGWAGPLVGNPRPKFHDLQAHVGLAHYRPYYALASHSVHAQAKALLFQYGSIKGGEDVLLAGPSNARLSEPIHHSAVVLCEVTELLCLCAQVEVEKARAMSNMLGPLGNLVAAIEDKLRREELSRG